MSSKEMAGINQSATVVPDTDPDTQWWWDALRSGDLLLPHCTLCVRSFFPPMPSCPRCGSSSVDSVPMPGHGTVLSWVVIHSASDPLFADEVPYTIAAVEYEGGGRVFGRIANGPLEDGTRVKPLLYTVGDVTLLGFERS